MAFLDTDHLPVPSDVVNALRMLVSSIVAVDSLPDEAQKKFWGTASDNLQEIIDEPRLDAINENTVRALYQMLGDICGEQLQTVVGGETRKFYESLLAQVTEKADRPRAIDLFLAALFENSSSVMVGPGDGHTDIKTILGVTVTLTGTGLALRGTLCLMSISDPRELWLGLNTSDGKTKFFSSRDIITLSFD